MITKSQAGEEVIASAMVFEMLADHLGSESAALAFMRAFAGTIIKVPSSASIERVARERQIIRALRKSPNTSTVRRLSGIQGTNMRFVAKTFAKATGTGLKSLRAITASASAEETPLAVPEP